MCECCRHDHASNDRKTLKQELTLGEVPGTIYGLTDNGWSNGEIFNIWFHNHFLTHAPAVRPLLLLLDGHSSHYNPSTLKMASKEKIIVFCLPPHTTHISQPLDVSCFSALKRAWHEACHQYTVQNPGKRVTRFQFSELFSTAWLQAMTARNVISGFRACGVCPLNPHVFQAKVDESSGEDSDADCSLPFVPLLTPRKKRCEAAQDEVVQSSDTPMKKRCEAAQSDIFDGPPKGVCEVTQNETVQNSDSDDDTVLTFTKQSSLSKFFPTPMPQSERAIPTKLSSSKVLTGIENLRILEAKAEQKKELQAQKEQRRIQREIRKAAKKEEMVKKKNAPSSSK